MMSFNNRDAFDKADTPVENVNHHSIRPLRQRKRQNEQSVLSLPTSQAELIYVQERHGTQRGENVESWQVKLLKYLNSRCVQHFFITLLISDVLILFLELGLDAFFPSCKIIMRDAVSCCPLDSYLTVSMSRILSENEEKHQNDLCNAPLVETHYAAGCDDHKYPGVHVAHNIFYALTVLILVTFEIELCTMIYLLGPAKFFSHILYCLDFFIVSVSLTLEILFRQLHQEILTDLAGLLIVFRIWRFVRIGHGLVSSTYELQEEKILEYKSYIHEIETVVKNMGGELPERKNVSFFDETSH